jgi:hypothetical protein
MEHINWNQCREVYVNRDLSIALVKCNARAYMEFDDYREHGGNCISELPPYTEHVGTFTNAEISNMAYPE